MKHLKPLALLTVVAMSLGVAGTASATTLTSSSGTTPTLAASAEGHVVLDNPIAGIECASSFEGPVESHGSGVTIKITISIKFTGCTNSWHVTTVSGGSFELHYRFPFHFRITWSGGTIEATRFGISCRYASANTDIGTLTGGEHATLDVEGAIPFHSGSGLCGSGATTFTGNYKVSSPTNVSADQ